MEKRQCVDCRREGIYICVKCNKDFCLLCIPGHDWTHSKLYNAAPKVPQNSKLLNLNLLCTFCYNDDGVFIHFKENRIHKICKDCKEVLASRGERVFDLEWESLLLKDRDSIRVSERSHRLRELSDAFKIKERDFNEERETLKGFVEAGLLESNKKLYERQKLLILQKKEETRQFFKKILQEAKEQLGNVEINEKTTGGRLLKACSENKVINELFDIKMIATIKEDREKFLGNLKTFPLFNYIPVKEFISPNSLYYFADSSNRVLKIDLLKMTSESKLSPIRWKTFASWCVLNNNEVIYSGGESNVGEAYKISYENLESPERIPPCIQVARHSNIYYKGYVYSFGGAYPYAQRLDLNSNEWENLSVRFGELGLTTTCAIEQGILIGAQMSENILLYNVEENKIERIMHETSHSTQESGLDQFAPEFDRVHCKLLLRDRKYVYCLFNNYLFRNNLSSLSAWETVCEIPLKKWFSRCQGVHIRNEIYFINDEDRKLWKLNCETYQLELVII